MGSMKLPIESKIYKSSNMYVDPNHNGDSEYVKDFYEDTTIFVTGATGFLGKVLIEKLLRSCGNLRSIIILLRPKRGLNCEQRFGEFIKNPVFDRVRNKTPKLLDKIDYVSGDINLPNIGFSDQDIQRLACEVNIVFHVAATVRFNESLWDAARLNTLGTKRVLELCMKMTHLKSVVHVSSAYSNPTRKNVGELVYPTISTMTADTFLQCINTLPKEVFEMMTEKLQGSHPNTYTVTKSMAEQIVADYSPLLPICIVRPSIVGAAIEEPYPGWVDNVYGVTGIVMEIFRGMITSVVGDGRLVMDLIPVDIVVNTMINSAWNNANFGSKSIRVYNCTSGQINPLKWDDFRRYIEKHAVINPTKYVMLYPRFNYRTNLVVHRIIESLLHFLPAYAFDIILRLQGKKPFMMKIAKRFQKAGETGAFFSSHEWIFENGNLKQMIHDVKAMKDGNEFNCDLSSLDWDSYVGNYILGIRKYVLKDGMESLPKAKSKIRKLYCMKRILQIFLMFLLYQLFLQGFDYFSNIA